MEWYQNVECMKHHHNIIGDGLVQNFSHNHGWTLQLITLPLLHTHAWGKKEVLFIARRGDVIVCGPVDIVR